MTLAALDLPIWLIAAAAYGVFAWFNERKQKKTQEEDQGRNPQNPAPPGQTPMRPESEEERMRKFLEALGVPSGPSSPSLRPTAPPAPIKPASPIAPKPAMQKTASPTLAPRPVAMPIPRPMVTRPTQAPARMAPAPRPKQPTVFEPESLESQDPGRLEEPATSVEQISTDFARMHGQRMAVDTLPTIQTAAMGAAGTTRVDARAISAQGLALRELLRNPETMRAAIVVSEVLGPPKGA